MLVVGLLVVAVVGTVSAATAALTPRRSYATVAIIGVFLIPNIAAALLVELDTGLLGQVAVLLSPADVLDGVNAFFFDVVPDNETVARAGLPGWSYLAAAGAWIARLAARAGAPLPAHRGMSEHDASSRRRPARQPRPSSRSSMPPAGTATSSPSTTSASRWGRA